MRIYLICAHLGGHGTEARDQQGHAPAGVVFLLAGRVRVSIQSFVGGIAFRNGERYIGSCITVEEGEDNVQVDC